MNRDTIKGEADKAKGGIKDAAGKLTGDAKLRAEGELDKAKGEVEKDAGDMEDEIKKH